MLQLGKAIGLFAHKEEEIIRALKRTKNGENRTLGKRKGERKQKEKEEQRDKRKEVSISFLLENFKLNY